MTRFDDGEEWEIGPVRHWLPGERLAFGWRVPSFAPDQATEVEVRFEVAKRRNGPASPATLMLDLTKGRFETVNGRRDVGATDDDAPWSAEG